MPCLNLNLQFYEKSTCWNAVKIVLFQELCITSRNYKQDNSLQMSIINHASPKWQVYMKTCVFYLYYFYTKFMSFKYASISQNFLFFPQVLCSKGCILYHLPFNKKIHFLNRLAIFGIPYISIALQFEYIYRN